MPVLGRVKFTQPGLQVRATTVDVRFCAVAVDSSSICLASALGSLGSLGSLASLGSPGSISSPFHQLLAGQGGMSVPGLPKPAELIQQAQALQLLAHLQTMLMTPTSSPASVQPRDNQTNFQKVTTI